MADYQRHFELLDLGRAGEVAMLGVRHVDTHIERTQPFRMVQDPSQLPQVGAILYDCAEALRVASVLLWPFIPESCQRFWGRLGCPQYTESLSDGGTGDLDMWTQWGQLAPGTLINNDGALFPRYSVETRL